MNINYLYSLFLVVACCLVSSPFSAQNTAMQEDYLLEKATAAMKDDHELALIYFDSLLVLRPNHAATYFLKGITYNRMRNDDGALASFNQAVALAPEKAEYYFQRSLVYSSMKMDHRGLEDIRSALNLDLENLDYLQYAASSNYNMGNFEIAAKLYDRLLASGTEDPDHFYYSGFAYQVLGQKKKAREKFLRALALVPNNEEMQTRILRSGIYSEIGRRDEAIAILDYYIDLTPENYYLYLLRGADYLVEEEYEKALADFGKAIELVPDNYHAFSNYAFCLVQLNRPSEALPYLDEVLEKYPYYYYARGNRGRANYLLGNYEKALADYNFNVEYKPKHPASLKLRGELYLKMGEREKGCADLKLAVDNFYDNLFVRQPTAQDLYEEHCKED